MTRLVETTRFSRRNLPHWEVRAGRYFVTVRCAGSLPDAVLDRIVAIERELAAVQARSAQFAALQRLYFATVERYLDSARIGPLRDPVAADVIAEELLGLTETARVPHFTVLPNHWHALVVPNAGADLRAVMKRIKGRTGRRIRDAIGGSGSVWQREWFDRWIRDDAEWARCVAYIRNNPVKAGLVRRWRDHRWTQ